MTALEIQKDIANVVAEKRQKPLSKTLEIHYLHLVDDSQDVSIKE